MGGFGEDLVERAPGVVHLREDHVLHDRPVGAPDVFPEDRPDAPAQGIGLLRAEIFPVVPLKADPSGERRPEAAKSPDHRLLVLIVLEVKHEKLAGAHRNREGDRLGVGAGERERAVLEGEHRRLGIGIDGSRRLQGDLGHHSTMLSKALARRMPDIARRNADTVCFSGAIRSPSRPKAVRLHTAPIMRPMAAPLAGITA